MLVNMSDEIMNFVINNTKYSIYELDEIDEENTSVGLSDYQFKFIVIKKLDFDFMVRTLKHELTHIWLWEYGHNQADDNKTFNNEDICEIVACSNDFINSVVERYVAIKQEKFKLGEK